MIRFFLEVFSELNTKAIESKNILERWFYNFIGFLLFCIILYYTLYLLSEYFSWLVLANVIVIAIIYIKKGKFNFNQAVVQVFRTIMFIKQDFSKKMNIFIFFYVSISASFLFLGVRDVFFIIQPQTIMMCFIISSVISLIILFQIIKKLRNDGLLTVKDVEIEKVRCIWYFLGVIISSVLLYYQFIQIERGQINLIVVFGAFIYMITSLDKFKDSFCNVYQEICKSK